MATLTTSRTIRSREQIGHASDTSVNPVVRGRWATFDLLLSRAYPNCRAVEMPTRAQALAGIGRAAIAGIRGGSVVFLASNRELAGEISVRGTRMLDSEAVLAARRSRAAIAIPGSVASLAEFFEVEPMQGRNLELRFGANGLSICFGRRSGRDVVSRVALSNGSAAAVEQVLRGAALGRTAVGDLAPEILCSTDSRVVESRLPGHTPHLRGLREEQMKTYVMSALRLLERQPDDNSGSAPDEDVMRALREFAGRHRRRAQLEPVLRMAEKWDRANMKAGIVHGDYWLGNLLFTGDNLSGVVDWDRARRNGCCCLDAIHLGFMSYSMWSNSAPSALLTGIWTGNWKFPWLSDYCERIRQTFALSAGDLRGAAAFLFLWYLYSKTPTYEAWEERMIAPLANTLFQPPASAKLH